MMRYLWRNLISERPLPPTDICTVLCVLHLAQFKIVTASFERKRELSHEFKKHHILFSQEIIPAANYHFLLPFPIALTTILNE